MACIWLQQGYDPAHSLERVVPDGCAELIINLREDRFSMPEGSAGAEARTFRGAVLSGTRSEYVILDTNSQASVMGVHFKPGGLFFFLSMPVSELHNEVQSLDSIWGHAADELRDRLLDAGSPSAKFRTMEQFLLRIMRKSAQSHPAVDFALRQFQHFPVQRSIADLSGDLGLSKRYFIRLFADEVGITPKKYVRIRRFQEVLNRIHAAHEVNWAETALACGYYDQAHFIHDFRTFSGINPSTYLQNRGEQQNHIPLHR